MATIGQVLRDVAAVLTGDEGRAEAELLLAQVLRRPRSWLLAHDRDQLEPESRARFSALIERRRQGEPVAYLLGHRGFWSLDLAVTADTLIPRSETERLVELALERLPIAQPASVLDLGTGTGAIALALASERPDLKITAVDVDARALAVAAKNAARLGLDRVRFLRSDWYSAVAGERYVLIAANPPYLAEDDPHLGRGDLRHEPRLALASGRDGLDAIRQIVVQAAGHLDPGGWLLVEHGWNQGDAVRALMVAAGLSEIACFTDLEGRERVTAGRGF